MRLPFLTQLLDGLFECGWEKGSTIEACKAKFQAFVLDSLQLERYSTIKCSDVNNIIAIIAKQRSLRSCRHLYQITSVIAKSVHCLRPVGFDLLFQVSHLTTLFLREPAQDVPEFSIGKPAWTGFSTIADCGVINRLCS